MNEWTLYDFEDTLVDCDAGKKHQIKSSEILITGKFPVIDQGQAFIAGYSNDESKLFTPNQGAIVFGDHTRIFKYVDFPFVIGADGTKVFYPNTELFDARFFFYYCQFLNIPSKGYNRHYTLLKERKISKPSITEQKGISQILSIIQSAIESQNKMISSSLELKNALMKKLFTEGTNKQPLKETEIGLIPESWEVTELDSVCGIISNQVQPNPNGNRPYIGLEHMDSGSPNIKRFGVESDVVSSKNQFLAGQIIYGKLRPYLDKAAIPTFDGICSTDILVFSGKNEVSNEFLIHFFHSEIFLLHSKSTTTGVQHPRTSWNALKKLKFALPPLKEREVITKTFDAIYEKIDHHIKKRNTLEFLFRSILHQLMTGKVRIKKDEITTENKLLEQINS